MKDLPLRILIGPLFQADQLGTYLNHPQIRAYRDPKTTGHLSPESPWFPFVNTDFPAPIPVYNPDWSLTDWLADCGDWQPDILIWWGFGHQKLPAGIENAPCYTVLLVSDWQGHLSALYHWVTAFDWVFCDRQLEQKLRAWGHQNVAYWPAYGFSPQRFYRQASEQRAIDIAYVGNLTRGTHPSRLALLAQIARLPADYRIVMTDRCFGADYRLLLNQSKIVFNYSLRGEMNLRAYEAAACGALLLIEETNLEVSEYLPFGEACVAYREDNLLDTLSYYLTHDKMRQRLADAGYQAIQNFSYESQFAWLIERLIDHELNPTPRPFKTLMPEFQTALRARQARQPIAYQPAQADTLIGSNQQAWTLYRTGQLQAARECCKQALKKARWANAGAVHMWASQTFPSALFPEPLDSLAEWRFAWEQAWQPGPELTQTQQTLLDWNLWRLWGHLCKESGDLTGALAAWEQAYALYPDLDQMALLMAKLLIEMGQSPLAVPYQWQAAAQSPLTIASYTPLLMSGMAGHVSIPTAWGRDLRRMADRIIPWQPHLSRLAAQLKMLGIEGPPSL